MTSALPDAFVATLLPADARWHQLALTADATAALLLYPHEREAVARAARKRRRDFAAGRHCAHIAMEALGGIRGPIPLGAGGAPCWPAGVVGSISHDAGLCIAAVAKYSEWSALGVDIELVPLFSGHDEETICTARERAALPGRHRGDERVRRMALVFCAKEAVYKAQYPLTGAWLDFADIEITLPRDLAGDFEARFRRAAGSFRVDHVVAGRCGMIGMRAAAAVALPVGACQ